MPVHQISVVPARETALNGRNSGRSKDKNKEESDKVPGRSGSRTSNISKASSSTTGIGPTSVSRTSVTPSSQDICSSVPLPMVEEDGFELRTPVMVLTPSGQQVGKRQVKRRHRRKKEPCQGCECLEAPGGPGEKGHRPRRERFRHRNGFVPACNSSTSEEEEEEEDRRKSRSWSRERARRLRKRSNGGREPEETPGGEAMELVSLGSDEGPGKGKENHAPQETGCPAGLKNRRKPSAKTEDRHCRGSRTNSRKLAMPLSPSNSSPLEEDHITKNYQQCGSGAEDLAVPSGRKSVCQNGTAQQCTDDELEVCRICHCEGDEECPLITPCHCTGSLRFVHPDCLHQWIKSSDTRCCELCKYDFIMETQLKPLRKWEKLQMSTRERRQIFCSVTFHIIAVICVVWSLYVLIDRTAEEIKQGKENGVLEWPFWTKLIVVAIGFTGGLIFMYIQCKVYLQLWRRLKAYNRIIFVQNCPDTIKKGEEKTVSTNQTNGKRDSVEVSVPQTETNSHRPAAGAAVPEVAPV